MRLAGRLLRLGAVAVTLTAAAWPATDLKGVRAEPDPIKRYRLALNHGEDAAGLSAKACKANEYEQCVGLLREVRDAVELASKSLADSGIDASRNAGHHKNAEIRIRKIRRVVEATRGYIHPEDQEEYEAVVKRISDLNDELLAAIMKRRKR
jgi:hypothetical protein